MRAALLADRRGDCHQPEKHSAAPMAVAVDCGGGRPRRHGAADVPRHGQWLPAHAGRFGRQRRRRRFCAAARKPKSTARSRASRSDCVEEGPGIARNAQGKPLTSAELYLVVDGIEALQRHQGEPAAAGHRRTGRRVRSGHHAHRRPHVPPGSNEIVVGKGSLSEFAGFEPGKTVTFGTSRWTVVGVFAADGSVFESEIWADLPVVQSLFNRNNYFQTVRARLVSPGRSRRRSRAMSIAIHGSNSTSNRKPNTSPSSPNEPRI